MTISVETEVPLREAMPNVISVTFWGDIVVRVQNIDGVVSTTIREAHEGGTSLGNWIADFNEAHNISGLVVGDEKLSNDQLRRALPDPVVEWAEQHRDQSFRRPKGKVIYTVVGHETNVFFAGARRNSFVVVRRSSDNETAVMGITEFEKMIRV